MKKIFTLLLVSIITINLFAQSPEKMSCQAVIRDGENKLVTNQQVGMQISILQGAVNGESVYTEVQTPTTNSNGLVSIEIGTGTSGDDFSAIDWANGPYFVKTETDPSGGLNYTISGVSQLLSVPYALYAENAGNIPDISSLVAKEELNDSIAVLRASLPDTGSFLTQEYDSIFINSIASSITSSDTILWNSKLDNEVDADTTNELQTLSISNDTIFLSNGSFVKIPVSISGNALNIIFDVTNASSSDKSDGSISATISGGFPPYRCFWKNISGGSILEYSKTISNLQIGDYQLNITDDKSNFSSRIVNVSHNGPKIMVDSIKIACENDGAIFITISEGIPPYTVTWFQERQDASGILPISANEDLKNIASGTYVIEVVDAEGLKGSLLQQNIGNGYRNNSIIVDDYLPNYTYDIIKSCDDTDGSIDITILENGAHSPFSYAWTKDYIDPSIISTNEDISGLAAGDYHLALTSALGCKLKNIGFRIDRLLSIHIGDTIIKPCIGEFNGEIKITPFHAGSELAYEWHKYNYDYTIDPTILSTNQNIENIELGTYLVKITNTDGCIANSSIVLSEFSPYIQARTANTSNIGETDGAIYFVRVYDNEEDCTSEVDYEWSIDDTFSSVLSTDKDLIDVGTGIYYLRITNNNGCQYTENYTVGSD